MILVVLSLLCAYLNRYGWEFINLYDGSCCFTDLTFHCLVIQPCQERAPAWTFGYDMLISVQPSIDIGLGSGAKKVVLSCLTDGYLAIDSGMSE